jgi:hypothetical protein
MATLRQEVAGIIEFVITGDTGTYTATKMPDAQD